MGKKMKKLLEIADFYEISGKKECCVNKGDKKGAGNHIPNRFQKFQGFQLN